MDEALTIISDRYSEQEIIKAQDIIMDLQDELVERGFKGKEIVSDLEAVFNLLSSALKRD